MLKFEIYNNEERLSREFKSHMTLKVRGVVEAVCNIYKTLCEWMSEQGQSGRVKGQKLLRPKKVKNLWGCMISHVLQRWST